MTKNITEMKKEFDTRKDRLAIPYHFYPEVHDGRPFSKGLIRILGIEFPNPDFEGPETSRALASLVVAEYFVRMDHFFLLSIVKGKSLLDVKLAEKRFAETFLKKPEMCAPFSEKSMIVCCRQLDRKTENLENILEACLYKKGVYMIYGSQFDVSQIVGCIRESKWKGDNFDVVSFLESFPAYAVGDFLGTPDMCGVYFRMKFGDDCDLLK
jgi:hypothetical protein